MEGGIEYVPGDAGVPLARRVVGALLGLLLQWRADRRKAAEAAYARRLKAYDDKRSEEVVRAPTWVVEDDRKNEG